MPDQPARLPPPLKGIYEASAYAEQPVGTTPDCQNVRGFDPRARRSRLCQRAALSKFNSHTLSGANAVRDLATVVKHDNSVTYTVKSSLANSDLHWQATLPGRLDGYAVAVDRQSNVYVAAVTAGGSTGINYIAKYNSVGALIWAIPVALAQNTHLLSTIRLDDYGDIYTCVGGGGTLGTIYKFRQLPDDAGLQLVWSVPAPNGGLFVDVVVRDNYAYALENTATYSYLHRLEGVYDAAPSLTWGLGAVVARIAADSEVAICAAIAVDGAALVAVCHTADPPTVNGRTSKYGPMLPTGGPPVTPIWSATGDAHGQAVVADLSGNVWTQGIGTVGSKYYRKLTDNGATASSVWTVGSAEVTGLVASVFKGRTSLAVDAQGVVYGAIGLGGSDKVLVRIKADGSGADWLADAGTVTSLAVELYGVVVDPNQTDNATKTECLYLVGTPLASSYYAVHRLDLLTISTADQSPRQLVTLGVCNGDIVKFARGTGAVSVVGSGSLSTTARWVMSASAFNRVLYCDGKVYKSYDAMTDAVTTWASVGTGQIPPRGRLLVVWNGRAVVSGFENDPHNWAMSEVGNFDGWDFFPPVTTPTQAVIGNNSPAGQCPDIITALIPYSDDLLIMGGDHTIYRLTGDPAAGGQLDLLTDRTGIVFGKAWCKDENGVLYFMGNQMDVMTMIPGGGPPTTISHAIEKRLKAIDISATLIRLEWNDQESGVHVILTPYAGGATTHYFWRREDASWWPDVLPNGQNPTSIAVSDGDDPSDRALLFGGSDGYVRSWDLVGTSDDSTAMTSYAVYGPLQFGGGEREAILKNLRVVMSESSGSVDYATYGADDPDYANIGSAVQSGTAAWSAGRNAPVWSRTRGQSVYLKVGRFVAPTAGVWAIESIDAHIEGAGVARPR